MFFFNFVKWSLFYTLNHMLVFYIPLVSLLVMSYLSPVIEKDIIMF